MKTRNYFRKGTVLYLFLLVFTIAFTVSCTKDEVNEDVQQIDPIVEAKMNFSNALGLWNNPENFRKKDGENEADLLQKRLNFVYEDSRNLLIASGESEASLNLLNKEEIFLRAIKFYTQPANQLTN